MATAAKKTEKTEKNQTQKETPKPIFCGTDEDGNVFFCSPDSPHVNDAVADDVEKKDK